MVYLAQGGYRFARFQLASVQFNLRGLGRPALMTEAEVIQCAPPLDWIMGQHQEEMVIETHQLQALQLVPKGGMPAE